MLGDITGYTTERRTAVIGGKEYHISARMPVFVDDEAREAARRKAAEGLYRVFREQSPP